MGLVFVLQAGWVGGALHRMYDAGAAALFDQLLLRVLPYRTV